jgi:hypothetical protein
MTVALHDAIPPGERVLIPFREWYVFVGRNPAIGLEGRSLPMFGTSLGRSVDELGVRYAVLVRSATNPGPFYWVNPGDGFITGVAADPDAGSTRIVLNSVIAGEDVIVVQFF